MYALLAKYVVVSGIGPDASGTGRLIQQLVQDNKHRKSRKVRIIYRHRPRMALRPMLKDKKYRALTSELLHRSHNIKFFLWFWFYAILTRKTMVFFHPQSFGTERASRLIRRWQGKVFYYVLDGGAFCIRSYNYLLGDDDACTACLGRNFQMARTRGCTPFPLADPYFNQLTEDLASFADTQKVTFLTQSAQQTAMLSEHFGLGRVHTVGLWTIDWNDLDDLLDTDDTEVQNNPSAFDVVFHGHYVDAKGADWLLAVARQTPELRYLFPCVAARRVVDPPTNVTFKPMSWEDALRRHVEEASITFVPSLWSACIEGALIKTILTAPRTGVVDIETAYQAELDDDLVHRFPKDPSQAANMLREIIRDTVPLSKVRRKTFWADFKSQNAQILDRITRTMDQHRDI